MRPPGARGTLWIVDEFGHGGIGRYAVDVANVVAPVADTVVATTDSGPVAGLHGRSTVWFARGSDRPAAKVRAAVLGVLRGMRAVRRGDVAWIPVGIRPGFELVLLLALRAGGARVVATVHNRAPHGSQGDSRLVRLTARWATTVVVHTDAMQTWASRHGTHALRLPFPPPDLADGARPSALSRAELGVPEASLLVAFLGYLYPYKGPDVLLRALSIAQRADPDLPVHLLLAGRPDPAHDLGALARELGVQARVTLRPEWLDEATLGGMLVAADVVALPYRKIDHSGIGALARHWRIPAIASDLPLLRDTFPTAALFARPDDPEDLARVLLQLPARMAELRAAADRVQDDDLELPYRHAVTTLLG